MAGRDQKKAFSASRALVSLGVLCAVCAFFLEGNAFVREGSGGALFFWPDARATLNLQLGCPLTPLTYRGPCWDDAATDAAARWNDVAARFRFSRQSPAVATSPCLHFDGVNTAAFQPTLCGMAFGDSLAVTVLVVNPATGEFADTDVLFDSGRQWSTYPGPLQRNASGIIVYDFHRVAIHEFGHTLGLDHPDAFGQQVPAIMNRRVSNIDGLQADDIAGVNAVYPAPVTPPVTGLLENPQGAVSGIGLFSGWVCTATVVTIQIDGATVLRTASGTSRADTIGSCADDGNNGFGLLYNFNLFQPGIPHTAVAYADGVEFARTTFTVTNFGQEFLRGQNGRYPLSFAGRTVTIEWQESLQNFVIVGTQ